MSEENVMRKHGKDEPPSPGGRVSAPFLIGKDSRGHWVVQDSRGMHGGLFVDRAQGLKYAMFENGGSPQAVIMVPGILELEIDAKPGAGKRRSDGHHAESKRGA
jgi:hypothetical protein